MTSDDVVTEISDRESWELLVAHAFGRLAYRLVDEVHIAPLNYRADRDQGRVLVRSAEGSKLLGVVMHANVALEVDGVEGQRAWSVVVRGRAELLEGAEARAAEAAGPEPWVDYPKTRLVAITVTEITGRRFMVGRS